MNHEGDINEDIRYRSVSLDRTLVQGEEQEMATEMEELYLALPNRIKHSSSYSHSFTSVGDAIASRREQWANELDKLLRCEDTHSPL